MASAGAASTPSAPLATTALRQDSKGGSLPAASQPHALQQHGALPVYHSSGGQNPLPSPDAGKASALPSPDPRVNQVPRLPPGAKLTAPAHGRVVTLAADARFLKFVGNFLQSFYRGQQVVSKLDKRRALPIERAGIEIFTSHQLDQMARTVQRDLTAIVRTKPVAADAMNASEWPGFIASFRQHPEKHAPELLKLINSFDALQRAINLVLHHSNFPRERVNIARIEHLRAKGLAATLDIRELLAAKEGSSHGLYVAHQQARDRSPGFLQTLAHNIHLALEGDSAASEYVSHTTQEAFNHGHSTVEGMLAYLGIPHSDLTSKLTELKNDPEQSSLFFQTLAEAIERASR